MIEARYHAQFNPGFKAEIERKAFAVVEACGYVVMNKAKRLLSAPGPAPSSPGESPHKQTGTLRASVGIRSDRATLSVRVGTPLHYGIILELRRNRPWLRRALYESKPEIQAILNRTGSL